MKLKEVLIQEEQVDETFAGGFFLWTPASTAGLVAVFGPTAAAWIMVILALGTTAALISITTQTSPKKIISDLKDWYTGKTTSDATMKKLHELTNEATKDLTRGQKTWVKNLQNKLEKALKEKDYMYAGRLVRKLKDIGKI